MGTQATIAGFEGETGHSLPPARTWEPPSYDHVELNSPKNLSEIGSGFIQRDSGKKHILPRSKFLALRDFKQRNQPSVPDF